METTTTPRTRALIERVRTFCDAHVLPRNREMLAHEMTDPADDPPFVAQLREKARAEGLWNFAMTELDPGRPGEPMSNTDYAVLAEYLGRVLWSSKVFNCQWPDVPNMVALQQWATPQQKQAWLDPLLDGDCHSAFAMTEPAVASSDARNIGTRIRRDGDQYVLDGEKWYITGAGHPRCRFYMLLGQTDPDAAPGSRHSVVMVPRDTPGLTIGAPSTFFGYREPSGPAHSLRFEGVRVPIENRIGAEGDGLRVAQARLAPARLHHCMRGIGISELLIELMLSRGRERHTFGRPIADYDAVQHAVALSRVDVEQMRLLTHSVAARVDRLGAKGAFRELAILKVGVAQAMYRVAERAVQVFGAMAGYQGAPVANAYAWARAFRIGDGPDEVHLRTIFRMESAPTETLDESPYVLPPSSSGLSASARA
ncbi:MAG: acyl-CoA dehydrogenase family protein [Burkholderiaceae bacterium]|nr:acyl-CoA dehydrogenase family protein [Burkholderiaceae bacterium]